MCSDWLHDATSDRSIRRIQEGILSERQRGEMIVRVVVSLLQLPATKP